jgi:hypothetical protein
VRGEIGRRGRHAFRTEQGDEIRFKTGHAPA